VVIGTLALLVLLQAAARQRYTDNPLRAEAWIFGDRTVTVAGAILTVNSLVVLAFTLTLGIALYLWFRFTPLGKAMLAVAESPHRAALSGVPVRGILWMSWAIGGALAAVAGVLVSPSTGVFPTIGGTVLFSAMIAALLGGFDSVIGALVGGLLLGLLETYAVVTVGGAYRDLIVFGLLVDVLLVRPSGLFGSPSLRRF
jgi:branched-chain amino acid transport system permease protein